MKKFVFLFLALGLIGLLPVKSIALLRVAKDGSGDYTSIQAALDNAAAGEEVRVIDGGTYSDFLFLRNKTLTSVPAGAPVTAPITIDGAGASSVSDFTLSPDADKLVFYILHDNADVTLSNLNITRGDGVAIEKAHSVTMNDCKVQNISHHGINIVGTGTDNLVLTLNRCEIMNSVLFGVALQRDATVTFNQCLIHDNGEAGFIAVPSNTRQTGKPITFDKTTFTNNSQCAMQIHRACDVVIRNGCVFNACPIRAINIDGSPIDGGSLAISDSQFQNNPGGVINLARNWNCTIDRSTFSGNEFVIVRNLETAPQDPTNITVSDSTFSNNGPDAVINDTASATTHNLTFQRNTFTGNAQQAILMNSSATSKLIVEKNVIGGKDAVHDFNLVQAHNLDAGSRFVNNLVSGGRAGLTLVDSAMDVYQNTFVNANDGNGVAVELIVNTAKPINIKNNIMDRIGNGVLGGASTGLAQLSVDYNLINAVAVDDAAVDPHLGVNNLLGLDAKFTSPSAVPGQGDFTLAADSPALTKGVDLGITTDLTGATRPNPAGSAPDLGAYERGGAVVTSAHPSWTCFE